MIKLNKKLYGTSLIALAFSLNTVNVNAQTCTPAPTCETLGFTKSSSDCSGRDTLKCPFDTSKMFCPEGGGGSGSADDDEAIAVGHIAYSDGTTSSVRKSGKTPIGVIVSASGLAINLENLDGLNAKGKCPEYSIANISGWDVFTSSQLKDIIKKNATTINDTLSKLSATALPGYIYYGSSEYSYEYLGNGNEKKIRCVIDISTINGTPVTPVTTYNVGDIYYKDGVACGKIVSLDSTKQHGVMVSSSAVPGSSKDVVAQNCNQKSTCGADWGIAECKDSYATSVNNAWTSSGCQCNYGFCTTTCSGCSTGYCQANF